MFDAIKAENLLFLDIETVPGKSKFEELPSAMQELWIDKFEKFKERLPGRFSEEDTAGSSFKNQAAFFAEFGKVVCISFGAFYKSEQGLVFKVSSFAGDDEPKILSDFADLIEKWGSKSDRSVCGHNIKEFDIPFLCRRMIISGISLPPLFDIAGKKPWEINFVDTMDLWKFGDYKHYISLKLLSAILGIPSPKDDIDGKMVAGVYYEERNIDRISIYCQKDVVATANVLLRLKNLDILKPESILYAG